MSDLFWPLPVSQVTEWPASPGRPNHAGTDFACPVGTPMRATSSGTIVYVGDDGLGGMTVDLLRPDGLLQRYGHLSQYRCTVGQKVNAGDVIALSGNTGMSTGPHLHWELRWDRKWVGGRWVDPRTLNPKVFGSAPVEPDNDGDDEMSKNVGLTYTRPGVGRVTIIMNPSSGFFTEVATGDQAYINNMAAAFATGNHYSITLSHRDALARDCAKVREGK